MPAKRSAYGVTLAAAALYLVVAALFVRLKILAPGVDPDAISSADLRTLYYPLMQYGFGLLRHGTLPLWNPYQSCGVPFLADPSIGFLYPLYLPFLFLPTALALDLDLALHLAIAGFGMCLLARHLGLTRGPAIVAGLVYAYQGSVMTRVAYPSFLVSIAAMPLIFLLVDRALLAPSRRRCAALAALLGAAFLGGYVQLIYFTALALLPFVATRMIVLGRERGVAAVAAGAGTLAGALALGVGVALVRIVPAIDFLRQSWRPPGGLSIEMASVMSVDPLSFLRGSLSPAAQLAPAAPWMLYALRESCVGPLPLALALLGLALWRQRAVALSIAAAGAAAVWYAFGTDGVLYPALFALPGGGLFRGPDRALIVYGFAAALLSGAGLHELLARLAPASDSATPYRAAGALALLAAALGLFVGGAHLAAPAGAALALGEGGLVLAAVAAAAWSRRTAAVVAVSAVAAAVILADLTSGNLRNGAMPSRLNADARRAGLFDAVRQRQGYDRTYIWATFAAADPLFFFSDVAKAGLNHGLWLCTDYAVSWQRPERFMDALGPAPWFPIGYRLFTVTADNRALLQLASTRFYLVPDGASPAISPDVRDTWQLLLQRDGVALYEDPDAQPRAFLVDRVEVAADGEAALQRLRTLDLRRAAVLELDGLPPPSFAGDGNAGRAAIVHYAPESVIVETTADQAAFLVLTDQYDAGWHASIDGAPAPVYRTDYLFRGVPVPAGTHRVELTYAPAAFRRGVIGSLAALALVALLALGGGGHRAARRKPLDEEAFDSAGPSHYRRPATDPPAPRIAATDPGARHDDPVARDAVASSDVGVSGRGPGVSATSAGQGRAPVRMVASSTPRAPHETIYLLAAVLMAGTAYATIVANYFHADDFYYLYLLNDHRPIEFLFTPHGGHVLFVRNLVFMLFHALFGTDPRGYFVVVLLTHLINVGLLYELIRRFTASPRLAGFGAALWGICPTHEGSLGWYSVYGQVLVATLLLMVLLRLARAADEPAGSGRWWPVACVIALLLAATSFGIGIGLALAFPFAAWLLLPGAEHRRTRRVFWMLPFGVLGVYLASQALYFMLTTQVDQLSVGLAQAAVSAWAVIPPMVIHLLIFSLVSLLVGPFVPVLPYPARWVYAVAAVFGLAVVALTWRGPDGARRRLWACGILALGGYTIIGIGRAPLLAYVMLPPGLAAAWPRYHYVGSALLAVIACILLGALPRLTLRPRWADALLAAWAAVMLIGWAFNGHAIDHHPADRAEVEAVLDRIEFWIKQWPPGSSAYIGSMPFRAVDFAGANPGVFPGWAAVFVAYFPNDIVEGRRVCFVEESPPVLEQVRARKGSRTADMLIGKFEPRSGPTTLQCVPQP